MARRGLHFPKEAKRSADDHARFDRKVNIPDTRCGVPFIVALRQDHQGKPVTPWGRHGLGRLSAKVGRGTRGSDTIDSDVIFMSDDLWDRPML